MANPKRKGLGRGLDALLGAPINRDEPATEPGATAMETPQVSESGRDVLIHLDPREITPNPKQPRRYFNEEPLQELAESLRRDGLQEPVIVRRRGGKYELVSGERRVRASVMADLATIPAICRDVADVDLLRLGIIENIQREDLNPVELARAYQMLMQDLGLTQEDVAEQVGKQRSTITNTLRLLALPPPILENIADGTLTMGHARALLAVPTEEGQMTLCRKVVAQGLSVRQTEQMAAAMNEGKRTKAATPKDPELATLESDLRRRLGTRVSFQPNGKGQGKIQIDYYSLDDLERILQVLRGGGTGK